MRNAILSQTFGVLGHQSFLNGIILVYLAYLSINDARIAFYLAIPFGLPLISIYLAHLADRAGKKKFGLIGCLFIVAGYAGMLFASFAPREFSELFTVTGIIIYALGFAFFNSSWFALMNPVVPAATRGRFWGRLRLSWQTVSIAFAVFAGLFLKKDAPLYMYQIVLAGVTAFLVIRIFFYARIPELEARNPGSIKFIPAFKKVLRIPGLLPFASYVFLLTLSMGAAPTLFGLVEKKTLELGDGTIVTLGAIMMVGSVIGFSLGGKTIDRFGTRPAFMTCHIGLGLVLLMFPARNLSPLPVIGTVGLLNCLYGVFVAVSSVAITTEMLALVRAESQALSTSFCSTMGQVGRSLSGVIAAGLLGAGLLRRSWTFAGMQLSQYDSILLMLGALILLLVVTLGLVPSVLGSTGRGKE
jgi:MFS family permease